jgi:hypothetical protein
MPCIKILSKTSNGNKDWSVHEKILFIMFFYFNGGSTINLGINTHVFTVRYGFEWVI